MRGSSSTKWIAAVVALGGSMSLAGCSLLFDPGRYHGGEPIDDAGASDGSLTGDARVDAGDESCGDDACDGEGEECIEGVCVDCDADDDEYYGTSPAQGGCAALTDEPLDCNDGDSTIHPDALPTCGDGIDQACLGSNNAFFGLADELGAYATREIELPLGASERPRTIRTFVIDDDRVIVLYQNGDPHRTPYMLELALSADESDPIGGATAIETLIGPFNGTVRADVFRDNSGVLRAGAVGGDTTSFEGVSLSRAFGDAQWTPSMRVMVQASTLGAPTFQALSRGALTRVGSSLAMAVVGTESSDGMATMLSIPLDGAAPGGVITRAVDPGPRWITSAGYGVVAPTPDGFLRYWGGHRELNVDTTTTMNAAPLATPIANPVVAVAVRGIDGEDTQVVAFAPESDRIRAFGVQCGGGMAGSSLATCGIWSIVPAPPPYDVTLAAPLLAVARVSRSALLLVLPGEQETDALRLAVVETDGGLPTELSAADIATEGAGVLREISVDAWFVPEMGQDMRGQMTLTYAYLREDEAEGRRLYVGAYRACAGYGGR